MSVITGLTPDMSISAEAVYHMEGIADQTAYGFASATTANLLSAPTPLALLDSIDPTHIFSSYPNRRDEILHSLDNEHNIVKGNWWNHPLFPDISTLV